METEGSGDCAEWLHEYRKNGHVTIPSVFSPDCMREGLEDVIAWSAEALAHLSSDKRRRYIDSDVTHMEALRILDDPQYNREFFRKLASDPHITSRVDKILGKGHEVFSGRIFFKAPGGGGPKPTHQDNFYFNPSRTDGLITVWIALEDADEGNGCLFYGDGSHVEPILRHEAPSSRPHDLAVPADAAARWPLLPSPVTQGGISIHHGNVFHMSPHNSSDRWRRACSFHYRAADVTFSDSLDADIRLAKAAAAQAIGESGAFS